MDSVLGLIGIFVYIVAMLALSAGVTFAVIKLSPADGRRRKRKTEET